MALPIIFRGDVPPDEVNEFFKHVCPPGFGGDNPDPQPPTFAFRRNLLVGIDLELPDGGKVKMWVIEDPDAPDAERRTFPSRTIRIPRDAVVNADVGCQGGTHTIHWHGIEPSPMNDGVGKHSFEVTGHFNYQFQPRNAGTFFYHCHKNTPLHFEMGLYGLLLIDPPKPAGSTIEGPPYPNGGPGFAAAFNPPDHVIPYDVEAFWVADSIDSRWHELGHDAFMQACDPDDPANPDDFTQDGILNDFRPDIFVLTGIPRRINDPTPFTAADHPLFGPVVAPTVQVGQTLLVRTLNADYIVQQFTLGIDAEVIAMDGKALGVPPFQQYSHPFQLPAGTPFRLTSAMRWDLMVKPTTPGTFPVKVEFFNQISGELLYTARTTINVTGSAASSISGNVTSGGVPLAGVTMTLGGAASATAITDAAGNYSFAGLADGAYTVTPSLAGFAFTPPSSPVTVSSGNVTNVNFVGTPAVGFSVSGTVRTPAGLPIAGVIMGLSGAVTKTVLTDTAGNYSLTGLPNGSYTVTPSRAGLAFTPPSRNVTISGGNVTSQDFTGRRVR
jgi:hypothetical protein